MEKKPWIVKSVNYWKNRIPDSDLGISWEDNSCYTHCWRCGHSYRLQRCHIIPESLLEEDYSYTNYENIVPLCALCHDEAPDVYDKKEVWRWISESHGDELDTFWYKRAVEEAEKRGADLTRFSAVSYINTVTYNCSIHASQYLIGPRLKHTSRVWAITQSCNGKGVIDLKDVYKIISTSEKSVISEKTRKGLERARSLGRVGGRPKTLTKEDLEYARSKIEKGDSVTETARTLSVSRATLYRNLKR